MRNDHHGKNNKLVKRAFALCLALAVICSCLLPVFATEGGWIATQELNASTQVATMDTAASTSQSGAVAAQPGISTGGGIATGGISRPVAGGVVTDPVVDSGSTSDSASSGSTSEAPASSTTESEPVKITDRTTITDADIPEGATDIVRNSNGSYSYTMPYGRVTVQPTKPGEKTTWTGEEAVVTPDDDRMKQDDAAFGVLPIEYHFWLKQLDSDTFRELDWEAQMAEMSETEYLALFGASEKFPIWHMDTISSVDTISNYKFANPTSKDDPAGQGREFAYWYTVDENGVESEFNPYNTYGSETATVVNVYAKWKNASGDVVNEDTTKEETTTSGETKTNPVEVSAKANIPDYDGEVTVTVTGLPSNVTHLSVTSMGENSMQNFYELYSSKNKNSTMMPLLGYKIAPKDANNETVQPKGPVTVTISGLPEDIMLSELAPFKVLHQVTDYDIETINASYSNGTLTFATDSFSPFVIAMKNQDIPDTMDLDASMTVKVDSAPFQLSGASNASSCGLAGVYTQKWTSSNPAVASVDQNGLVTLHATGTEDVIIYHTYCAGDSWYYGYYHNERTEQTKIHIDAGSGAWVYLYAQVTGSDDDLKDLVINAHKWFTIGRVWVSNLTDAESAVQSWSNPNGFVYQQYYKNGITFDKIIAAVNSGAVERYEPNQDVTLSDIVWNTPYGLKIDNGADDYVAAGTKAWHLDGSVSYTKLAGYTVNFLDEATGTKIRESISGNASIGNKITAAEFYEKYRTIVTDKDITYTYDKCDKEQITIVKGADNVINLYYVVPTSELSVTKTVTGAFGETGRNFKFALLVKSASGAKLGSATFKKYSSTGAEIETGTVLVSYETIETNNYAKYEFELKHGEKIVFSSMPKGDYIVREDDYLGDKYTTSYAIGEGDDALKDTNRIANVTVGADAAVVTFTNHRTLEPDLGVLLDTLPYIVILAVVAGGGVLLMLRKRRKNDD